MANNPFGAPWGGMPGNDPGGFEALSRQYWSAWGDALRNAGGNPAASPAMPGWQQAIDWWSNLAHGGRTEANDVLERFNAQARHWFGQMQQVAAQFAGQDHNARQVTDAWKQALGAAGENPFPEIFRAMRGHGQQGLDQWIQDASPYLDAMRRESNSWLSMPTFGLGREHQERLQALARAQADYQERSSAYNALMAKAGQVAFELFESKLAEREEPGRGLTSARALFDLWIDASEEAYADIALSTEFRDAYGSLVNAQMRLRSGIQNEVERACEQFGMPTRTEIDAAHRKIAQLERELRRMRNPAPAAPARAVPASAAGQATEQPAVATPRRKSAANAAAARSKPAPVRKVTKAAPAAASRAKKGSQRK